MTDDHHLTSFTLFQWRSWFVLAGLTTVSLWLVFLQAGIPSMGDDTFVYIDQGERIWQVILHAFESLWHSSAGTSTDATSATNAITKAAQDAVSIRSLPYAAFVGALFPASAALVVWVQTFLVFLMIYGLVLPTQSVGRPIYSGFAVIAMLTLTALPFIASSLMPDILGAVVVLFALILLNGFERFTLASQITLAGITIFAIFSHYGNIPLAVVAFVTALFLRFRGTPWFRRTALVLGSVIAIVIGGNILIGAVLFDTPSTTPQRFPILLARSIQDGPARWHLEEHCETENYAVCQWFGDAVPNNVGDALWGPRGMEQAPDDLKNKIRSEELTVLWSAFKEYPVEQLISLTQNMLIQLNRFGVKYARPQEIKFRENGRRYGVEYEHKPLRHLWEPINWTHRVVFFACAAALLVIGFRQGAPYRNMVILIVLAMFCNAAVFGGLSAPGDRYHARISWLVPLLIVLFLTRRIPKEARA